MKIYVYTPRWWYGILSCYELYSNETSRVVSIFPIEISSFRCDTPCVYTPEELWWPRSIGKKRRNGRRIKDTGATEIDDRRGGVAGGNSGSVDVGTIEASRDDTAS